MKIILYLLIALVISANTFAQNPGKTIGGIVKDMQNQAIAGATVKLFRLNDTTQTQLKITNGNGKFDFQKLQNGTYFLKITAVGNKDYHSARLTIEDKHPVIELPVIILAPAKATQLKEVVVAARRPLIEQEIDKTVVNVDAMISAAGSNTLEVLEKTPGVTIDANGTISLNGQSGVLVLIEGRPTYMSGQDLAAYLKSLPGGSLDKIELMSNPPAKYDASGSAVINIKLKKNKVQGFNGNATAAVSKGRVYNSYDMLNLNYLDKKINLFGSIAYSKNDNYIIDAYDREFFDETGAVIVSQNIKSTYRSVANGVNVRLGMDYMASEKTIYGFSVNLNNRPRHDMSDYITNTYNASGMLDSVGRGTNDGRNKWFQSEFNLNFQHKFDKKGKELSGDFNYVNYNSDSRQSIPDMVFLPDGSLARSHEFLYLLPSGKNIYTARLDYTQPLKGKAKLEAGIKTSFVNSDNTADYFNVVDDIAEPDYSQSNRFIYKENINAAYINTRKEWKRFGTQIGLRLENTQISGDQLGNAAIAGSTFSRSYTNLFPTFFLNYKLDSTNKQSLTFSYAQRVNRPNYQQLNPFLLYRDSYSYTSGNPYLNPTFNYHMEVGYNYRQLLGLRFIYDRLKSTIFDATQSVDNVFIVQPQNLAGGGRMLDLRLNLNFSPTRWWSINYSGDLANFRMRGSFLTETLKLDGTTTRGNLLNQFMFTNGWSAELGAFYITRQIQWQRVVNGRSRVNAAIQKRLWKGKGSLKISADDIFHTFITRETLVSLSQAASMHTFTPDYQRFGIALNYNFGNELFARKRKHNDNAADAEKGRAD